MLFITLHRILRALFFTSLFFISHIFSKGYYEYNYGGYYDYNYDNYGSRRLQQQRRQRGKQSVPRPTESWRHRSPRQKKERRQMRRKTSSNRLQSDKERKSDRVARKEKLSIQDKKGILGKVTHLFMARLQRRNSGKSVEDLNEQSSDDFLSSSANGEPTFRHNIESQLGERFALAEEGAREVNRQKDVKKHKITSQRLASHRRDLLVHPPQTSYPTHLPTTTSTPSTISQYPTLPPSGAPTSLPSSVPTPAPSVLPSNAPTSLPSAVPTSSPSVFTRRPDHAFDFRACTVQAGQITVIPDTYNESLSASLVEGGICTANGVALNGRSQYVDVTPWEFGGEHFTVEARVYQTSFSKNARVFDFGNTTSNHINVFLAVSEVIAIFDFGSC